MTTKDFVTNAPQIGPAAFQKREAGVLLVQLPHLPSHGAL